MNKKILIGVAVALVIIAAAILSFKSPKNQKTGENGQPANNEVAQAELDKSMASTIESLKSTCADFLKGDLSGDPESDCPGFDKSVNRSLCLYCYATRDQNSSMCGQINNDVALRSLCQKATGIPIDNLTSQ